MAYTSHEIAAWRQHQADIRAEFLEDFRQKMADLINDYGQTGAFASLVLAELENAGLIESGFPDSDY